MTIFSRFGAWFRTIAEPQLRLPAPAAAPETKPVRETAFPPGVSYKVRRLNGLSKIDVRASDGTARVFWSWSLSEDRDPREFLDTVAYPAIRRFMAADGTRGR